MKLDNVLETILSYDTYKPIGDYGVTSLEKPRYWMKLKEKYPKENCLPVSSRIDSRIGTGFHIFAKEAMDDSTIMCSTEVELSANIGEYKIGGTCDLILWDEDMRTATVADYKTMKAYPAKKAFNNEEIDKFIKQLSLYAYMLRKQGTTTKDIGYIYVIVVGWTARDRDVPRAFRLEYPLMTDEEVEKYVKEKIRAVQEINIDDITHVDCPTHWMCAKYCELRDVCPAYNNHEFKK